MGPNTSKITSRWTGALSPLQNFLKKYTIDKKVGYKIIIMTNQINDDKCKNHFNN